MAFEAVLSRFAWHGPGNRPGVWRARCPLGERHRNGDRSPSVRLWVGDNGWLNAKCYGQGCTWREMAEAIGTPVAMWGPDYRGSAQTPGRAGGRGKVMPEIVAVYDYREADGTLSYQVCRTSQKGFFPQRRPIPDHPGHVAWTLAGGWFAPTNKRYHDDSPVWEPVDGERPGALQLPEVKPLLYRLPELLADPAAPVCVAEGEKDVLSLVHLGFVATTNSGGGRGWKPGFGGYLSRRRVVVFPDQDETGAIHAAAITASAIMYRAESVRVVEFPRDDFKAGGKDISDWLRAKWPDYGPKLDTMTRERVRKEMRAAVVALVRASDEWRVAEPACKGRAAA